MSVESWKEIPGFPDYEISTFGKYRRVRRGKSNNSIPRVLKPNVVRKYAKLALYKDGRFKSVSLHRTVLLTFVGEPPTAAHVGAHNDGNTRNNRLDNLRWATSKENAADRILHGTHPRGVASRSTKLTEKQIIAIRRLKQRGIGAPLISAAVGISQSSAERILSGKSFKDIPLETAP